MAFVYFILCLFSYFLIKRTDFHFLKKKKKEEVLVINALTHLLGYV